MLNDHNSAPIFGKLCKCNYTRTNLFTAKVNNEMFTSNMTISSSQFISSVF